MTHQDDEYLAEIAAQLRTEAFQRAEDRSFERNSIQKEDPYVCPTARQAHYDQYDVQPIDFIVQVAGPEWCAGNIIKYAARYREKNGVEDIKKAATYCKFLINILEGRQPRDDG